MLRSSLTFAEIQRIAVADLCQRVQDQPCRDALGNRAGQRDTGDIELADDDEKQVEQDVQHARKRQVGQRLFVSPIALNTALPKL